MLHISTKSQTDVHPVLTLPGSRWLQILALCSCRPSNHTSDMSATQVEEEGCNEELQCSSGSNPVEHVFHTCIQEAESRVSINHCQPFLLGYNFPKDEVVQHAGKTFCSQLLWVSYNVFQPLTWATSCIEFYYTDMIARQFHTYPILSKG